MKAATLIAFLLPGIFVSGRALLAAPANYSFSPLQIPQGTNANVAGVNNRGQIVGHYTDSSGQNQGFVYSSGAVTPIDVPGELMPDGSTPLAINDSGAIVGYFYSDAREFDSFLYNNGVYTILKAPPNSLPGIFALDINNHGQIVGGFGSFSNHGTGEQGFSYSGGTMTVINYPGASNTSLDGINDAGQIVGTYYDAAEIQHGFLDSNNVFTTIDSPFGMTELDRINNAGQIAGYSPNESFLYANGVFTTVSYPDPDTSFTQVTGLNDAGELVGNYSLGNTPATQPFIANVIPEPGSLAWIAMGLAGVRRRRPRRQRAVLHSRSGPNVSPSDPQSPA